MNQRIRVKNHILNYLKSHFLEFREGTYDGTDRITMIFRNCEESPGKVLEGCIYFLEDCMDARVYYSVAGAEWCASSSRKPELFELLNYINAKVWPRGTDGVDGTIYESERLYAPRIYMTEDGCHDITMTDIIPYDFFEVAPLETEDYFTAALPELLNAMSPAIFLLLLEKIDLIQAKRIIDRDVLGEE